MSPRPGVASLLAALGMLLAASCAHPPAPASESILPGTIGATVRRTDAGLAVTALRPSGPAERAGLRVGDVLSHFNGLQLRSGRQFHALVVKTPPGGVVSLTVRRGIGQTLQVPVEQLDLAPGV